MDNINENREVAIQISGVKKRYKLGQIGGGTLQADLQSWWARVRGKEDPNTIIGQEQRLVGQTFMALNGIDLTVYKGEALGIIGANGAGKSTMLKLLCRVTAPTEGEIDIYGRIASMLEVGTGFNKEMTGRENVYMNGAILGMTKAEIDAKMEQIIEFSEVRDFIDTPVKRYSSGMYVKLAFSVAAHLDSEIMIMDEVLAVGDMAFQKKCLDKMSDVSRSQGRTILYVSHNMNTIRQLCKRCIVLDHGKLIYDGEVEEGISRYMDAGGVSFERWIDLTSASRLRGISRRILFVSAEIHRDNNVYSSKEPMELTFTLEAESAQDNIRFMMILFYQDGTRIGKTESEDFSVQQGLNEIPISVPNDGLADGAYYYEISILQRSRSFAREKCDCIPNVIPFSIYNTEVFGIKGERWKSNYWGHIMMEPIRVISCSDEIRE